MPYKYILYGLKISSAIKLGKLPLDTFASKADVVIKKDKLNRPPKGKTQTLYKPFSVISYNFFYLDVKGIARYKVADKNTLIVDKYKNATWAEVVLFLLDSILECVLIFHEKFILKASAVSYNNEAYLFCGSHGVGKSALAAILHKKNIKIIEDDKCWLQWNEKQNGFFIKNQYPYATLWGDVQVWEENKQLEKGKALRKDIQKYAYNIKPVMDKRKLRVKKIFALEVENTFDSINKKEIKGLEKANFIRQFVPKHHLIAPFAKVKPYFQFLSLLSKNVDFIHLVRARKTSLQKFSAFVKTELHTKTVS